MPGSENLGDWLRGQLKRRNLSARDVASALDVAPKAVYDWIGEKARPRDEHAARLADLLGEPEIDVRRRFGLWVPDIPQIPELQEAHAAGYELGRSLDDSVLAEMLRGIDHRLLLAELQRRLDGE